jgi:hypothetical protein
MTSLDSGYVSSRLSKTGQVFQLAESQLCFSPSPYRSDFPQLPTSSINQQNNMSTHEQIIRKYPRCIATISAGFEKGDFLVREEKGQRVYFDFFEEAFNYIAAKGYSRMPKGEEGEWMDLMVR